MAIVKKQRWLSFCLFVLLVTLEGTSVYGQKDNEKEDPEPLPLLMFDPPKVEMLKEGKSTTVMWYTNMTISDLITNHLVMATMMKWREAEVSGVGEVVVGPPDLDGNVTDIEHWANITLHGYINVTAKFVGFNTLTVQIHDDQNETIAEGKLEMTIDLTNSHLTTIFSYVSGVFTVVIYFAMGMTINLEIIKKIAKRPVGPVVGIFCQYILMPLLSFGIGLMLFPDDSFDHRLIRLGIFVSGCCPGGGASNMWTHLLKGSLDLSIMMTGTSTFIAFASVPLWVLTMGPIIVNDATFVIPYEDITITVITLIIPCGIGIAIQYKWPGTVLVKICSKAMSPLCILSLCVTFTFGIYAYLYVFTLFTWQMLVAGLLLPTLGYMAGMFLALIFRLDVPRVIAIGVETGVQNYTIALIILNLTLQPPGGQIASAMPAAFTLFTPLPLLILLFIRRTYLYMQERKQGPDSDTKDEAMKDTTSKDTALQHKNTDTEKKGVDNFGADLTDKV